MLLFGVVMHFAVHHPYSLQLLFVLLHLTQAFVLLLLQDSIACTECVLN
jgi:hypothetical protein